MAKKTSTQSGKETSQRHLSTKPSDSRSHHEANLSGNRRAGNGPASMNRRGAKSHRRSIPVMPMNMSESSQSGNQARCGHGDRFEQPIHLDAVDEDMIDAAISQCAPEVLKDLEEEPQDEELEAMARQLQQCKMEKGIAKANRDWLDAPFEEWNDNLCNHVHNMSKPHAVAICVAMADMLSSRDALIMSLVGATHAKIGVKAMLDLAAEPHDPANVIRLYRLLDAAFNDAEASPDLERCSCGIDMLADMSGMVCGRFEVQPLTVAAYGSWWVGSDDALDYAREALCLDEQCTLARIICSAINQGLRPAWQM
ncbi:hypothetical protein OZX67_06395 [Bifidobacterium sp. ESL0728]|uniref:hypothetical protein n=1 Tax=Bifidobacterium sp. ESL0728 TaxID=2983220 RepID=UPI0023F71EEF|nr:hypothetical protein [Bifidobacterium sp. ESL0728]WEV58453.1 hypothetical protein OZX67_06395 [Bifidobacterium sp. ESL0728]